MGKLWEFWPNHPHLRYIPILGGGMEGFAHVGKFPPFPDWFFVLKGSPVQAQDVIDDFQIQAFEAVKHPNSCVKLQFVGKSCS